LAIAPDDNEDDGKSAGSFLTKLPGHPKHYEGAW
jgi:hypothetical protein